jgi:hypothetical protein
VARWTCPQCDREFARARQSHTCLPGNSIGATFRGRPPEQREICDAIVAHLEQLGDVHVDAVQVGVFLKTDRKIAELRPKSKWLECSLYLPYVVDDPRIARSLQLGPERTVNYVKLRSVDEVDEQFLEWLEAAFDENTD